MASVSEQPEPAQRPGCAHRSQPQEQPRLGRRGHVTPVREGPRVLARGSAPPLYAAHSGGWVTPGVLRQVLRSRVSGFNRNTFTVTLELALARSLISFTTYQGSTAPGESCLRERKRMQSLLSSAEAEKDWPSARALSLLREPRTWHKRQQGGQPRGGPGPPAVFQLPL